MRNALNMHRERIPTSPYALNMHRERISTCGGAFSSGIQDGSGPFCTGMQDCGEAFSTPET